MASTSDGSPGVPARSRARLPLLAILATWALLAVTNLFGIPLASLWLIGLAWYTTAWLLTVAVTFGAAHLLWRRHRRRLAVAGLAAAALAGVGVVAVDWNSMYAHGWFRLHRSDFAVVAGLADRGELDTDEFYGRPLPEPLRHLSVNERAAWIHSFDGDQKLLFVPAWIGLLDGAGGFAYHPASPPDTAVRYHCFGDPCQVGSAFGDGWYRVG
ncbi:hypothetical protein [Micromonospora sp. NBC_01813]|uniref:hypothetical protein n=1 Tax=Micromonospora sp. NBC_01813 TaxID=2975988 RepID=UPI002DDAE170|nr:hypothetical protein [Micromonospora sp. NBC_01813]WSA06213.1 hypothetical protein OG958_17930 [Micromonospora sp. NBC_01813]